MRSEFCPSGVRTCLEFQQRIGRVPEGPLKPGRVGIGPDLSWIKACWRKVWLCYTAIFKLIDQWKISISLITIYIYTVCVDHLKRCKTSTYSRGTRHPWPTVCNEATVLDGISRLITLTYLQRFYKSHSRCLGLNRGQDPSPRFRSWAPSCAAGGNRNFRSICCGLILKSCWLHSSCSRQRFN